MIVCGVELTGSDAVVCLLNMDRGQFNLPECKVRKLSLPKNHSREDLKRFQAAFAELMAEYGVTRVAIKERMPKGKFAGGAISFKLVSRKDFDFSDLCRSGGGQDGATIHI